MTAATIHRPDRPQPKTALPTQRSGRPAQRPVLQVVPPLAPEVTPHVARQVTPQVARQQVPSTAAGAVHLTRRGRLVLLVLLVGAGVALTMALTGLVGGAAAGTAPARPATRTIVVQPGQTLWSIAGTVAPNVDRRDTIARIVELNALPSTAVSAGARIAVPTR